MSIGINHRFENALICPNGDCHSRIPYRDYFEDKLSEKLMDKERGELIYRSCEEHVFPELGGDWGFREEWKNCLLDNAYVFGHDVDFMKERLSAYSDRIAAFIRNNPESTSKFFENIADREKCLNRATGTICAGNKKKSVVILTSSSGGGHKTTAEALKKLAEEKGFEGIIIDQDELAKDQDPLKIAGVRYRGEEITMAEVYNKVFQQDNDLEKANELWALGNEIRKYVPNNQMSSVAERIRQFAPAHLFSVATHHAEHAALAHTTGTPLTYVHTDFDFNNALRPIVNKVDQKLVDFWVNAADPEILATDELKDLKDKGVIKVCGYPVREAFTRETNPQKISQIKSRLKIRPRENVAVLSMGRQGIAEHIKKYASMLAVRGNGVKEPLNVVIVCGKNERLKKELEEMLRKIPRGERNPRVRFTVEGFLEEEKMADYYKVADALISKPGGATSAEAARMGVPMLSCDPHVWEEPNERYLVRHGLGEHLKSDESFVDQLSNIISEKKKGVKYRPIDWKATMCQLFRAAIPETVVAKPVEAVASRKLSKIAAARAKLAQKREAAVATARQKRFDAIAAVKSLLFPQKGGRMFGRMMRV